MFGKIVGSIAVLVLGVGIWFVIPYSPLRSYFEKTDEALMNQQTKQSEIFEWEAIQYLPVPMQKYFEFSGLMGKPMMKSSQTIHTNVDFILTEGKPSIKMKYIQNNYADVPKRMAFIDTRMYGIPFQGLDSYIEGVGCMKGVLAKAFCLFEQKGEAMDQAALVTVLAESIVCPSAFLMDCITWESIDDTHVKATISDNGMSASGVFTFSEEGAILSFQTNERYEITPDGRTVATPWTAECGNYVERDGIKYPTTFKGIWNRETEDLVYFECNQVEVNYRY